MKYGLLYIFCWFYKDLTFIAKPHHTDIIRSKAHHDHDHDVQYPYLYWLTEYRVPMNACAMYKLVQNKVL